VLDQRKGHQTGDLRKVKIEVPDEPTREVVRREVAAR
jgi:hypothetical protein